MVTGSYRTLGPLEVLLDGVAVDLGSRKQRIVLGVLLAAANQEVSTDRLVFEVWGDHAPVRAPHSLHTYVSNLRRLLGRERIERGDGYVLRVAPAELDAAVFEDAVVRGSNTGDDPASISERLRPALAMWRSEHPFEGLTDDVPILEQEATRLVELRLAAFETLLEAELALGRAAESIPTLQALADRHPFRERLVALQMRALQTAGRQVEALDVYRRLRNRLVEELGIDPSPELQDLEYRILSQTMPVRTSPPVRTTLPVLPSTFIGRDRDLEVTSAVVGRARIVTITGPAGVGKTRLVIEAAYRIGDRFPDGVFFVDLAAASQPEDVPSAVAAGLAIHDHSARPPVDVVADRLRVGRLLLVLDNCEHLSDTVALLAYSWVTANSDLHVLASSQRRLNVDGEHVLILAPLSLPNTGRDPSESDAVDLFVDRVRERISDFDPGEFDLETIRHVCVRLDGLPLAIELAAARAESISIAEIAARLGERFDLLTEGRSGSDRHRTLQRAVEWSYSLLDDSERRVFDRLSVLAGTFSLQSVEALIDPDDDSSSALDRFAALVTGSLVVRVSDARYRMLETMKAFGRAQLESRGELDEAELRRAQHFAGVAVHQSNRLRSPDFADAWRRLDQEMDDFRQAFRWSVEHDRIDLAFDLTRPQWSLVFTGSRHHFHEGNEWRGRLLEMDPVDTVKSRLLAEQAFVAFFLGDQLGAVDNANRSRAIEDRDSATDTLALQVLALCAATNQQTDRAIELAERAIELGGDDLDAHGLESLTFAHLFGGNALKAVETAERVVTRAEEQAYPLRRIRALALLGAALQPVDLERSVAVLDEAVAVTEGLGMEWDLAGAVMARGGAHLLRRDLPRAIADLGWACELTYSVRDLRRLTQTLELLGQVAAGNGYSVEAVELLSAAQSLRVEIGVVGDSAKSAERAAMLTEAGRDLPPQIQAGAATRGRNASAAEAAKAGMALAALMQRGIAGG